VDSSSILAVVAIGVSALMLLWTIFWSVYTHRRATRARLTVTTSFSVPVYGRQLGQAAIDITATNTGPVAVTVSGTAFEVKGRSETVTPMEWLVQTPAPLPLVLEPGRHWNGLVDAAPIVEALAR